jgi:hypothetical protein
MTRSITAWLIPAVALVLVAGTGAHAQEPPVPPAPDGGVCASVPCGLVFDWGPGKTAGTYGADRRYGSGDDFESGVRRGLTSHGLKVRSAEGAAFTITIRPRVDTRAMCDAMAGTGTNYGCAVVSDVAVAFAATEATVKAPGALRLNNRCGGERAYLSMSQFGAYVGEMVWWSMSPDGAKERRPALRC